MNYIFKTLLIIAWITLGGCSKSPAPVEQTREENTTDVINLTDEQYNSIGISLGKIEERKISDIIKVNGQLEAPAQNIVTVSAMLGGFVKNFSLLQGMRVYKGQTLAVLEHPDYIQLQQDFLEAQSVITLSEQELTRQEELAKNNVNAKKTLEEARAHFQSAKARVDGLKAKLSLINLSVESLNEKGIQSTIKLYSPVNGYVTQVYINTGMFVNPNQPLFRIVDTEHLHAEAVVYEKDITHLKVSQKLKFRLMNEQTERVASVYLIGKELDPERTIRVHCHLEKEDAGLLPGMFFTGEIQTDSRDVSSLPEEAVVLFEGKHFVFVPLRDGEHKYQIVEVSVGRSDNGFVEVRETDKIEGGEVVLKGAFELLSFLKNNSDD